MVSSTCCVFLIQPLLKKKWRESPVTWLDQINHFSSSFWISPSVRRTRKRPQFHIEDDIRYSKVFICIFWACSLVIYSFFSKHKSQTCLTEKWEKSFYRHSHPFSHNRDIQIEMHPFCVFCASWMSGCLSVCCENGIYYLVDNYRSWEQHLCPFWTQAWESRVRNSFGHCKKTRGL